MPDRSKAASYSTSDDAAVADMLAEPAPDPADLHEAAEAVSIADAQALPTLRTRVWQGGTADWYDPSAWRTTGGAAAGYPLPGDTADIGSGTAVLLGSEAKNSDTFSGNNVNLGGQGHATLDLVDATVGGFFNVTSQGDAEILATGTSTFSGSLRGGLPGATTGLTLASLTNGSEAGNLVLEQAIMSGVGQLTLQGTVTVEGRAALEAASAVNDGTVHLIGNSNAYDPAAAFNHIAGDVSGHGSFDLRFDTTLQIDGAVGSGQTISFGGVGDTLALGRSATFAGSIASFGIGDRIDLKDATYDADAAARYDAGARTLTVSDAKSGQVLASLANVEAQDGALTVTSDGSTGGLTIGYAAALPPATYGLRGGDMAMRSDVARATLKVPGTTTPIDGTGIKIGIISGSLDYHESGTPDPLAAAIQAGYVPADLADGSHNLQDGTGTSDNEGLAMAELVHQVAPGADIYFASAKGSGGVAGAVELLDKAGCRVIADDIAYSDDPHYQINSSACSAIENAVQNHGVNYFVAAGNFGHAFLDSDFKPSQQTLLDGSTVKAQVFGNGTPYELISVPGNSAAGNGPNLSSELHLQWAAPVGQGSASALQIKVFDANNDPVTNEINGSFVSARIGSVPGCDFALPASTTGQVYKVAVYQAPGATVRPSEFEFTLQKAGGSGESPGGTIDDLQAGAGAGNLRGDELLPDVNTIGQIDFASSAVFGQKPSAAVPASDFGPGELLYQPDGTPYPKPVSTGKVDMAAPSGIDTSVANFTPFFGTSAATPNAAAVAALMLQANPNLTTAQVTQLLEQSAIPFGDPDQTGAGLIQADTAISLAVAVACFCKGTRIRAVRGSREVEVAIEALAIGDLVVTASGDQRAVRWIGTRSYSGRFASRNPDALPVRFKAGSLADNVPVRDLLISPKHAMFLDGVLVPAEYLVNGLSIIKETRVDRVDYYHVELDSHDVLLAEGAASESFVDDGGRAIFQNAHEYAALFQHERRREAVYCAPRLDQGFLLEATRKRIRERAHGRRVEARSREVLPRLPGRTSLGLGLAAPDRA